jgi:hypothetical protein
MKNIGVVVIVQGHGFYHARRRLPGAVRVGYAISRQMKVGMDDTQADFGQGNAEVIEGARKRAGVPTGL